MRCHYTGTKPYRIDAFDVAPDSIVELTDRQLYELPKKDRSLFVDTAPVVTAEDIAVAAGRATRKPKSEAAVAAEAAQVAADAAQAAE